VQQSGETKTILFNLSGHGHFDMGSYDAYLDGKLEDYAYPEEKIKEAMKRLPSLRYGRACPVGWSSGSATVSNRVSICWAFLGA